MENLRKELKSELMNLEIGVEEPLSVKLVTTKFKRKALRVHSDKTKGDDEEFKQLLNDYNRVKDAIKEALGEGIEDEGEKSDLQSFFEAHNFAKEFSQSWTIFVEKDKVTEWKKELSNRYPDPKELQGKGTQYKAPVDNKIVYATFYDVEVPKMNIQGNHESIRNFVLNMIPEIYKNVKQSLEMIGHGERIVHTEKQNLDTDLNFKCNVCGKTYIRKFAFDKHLKQHTGIKEHQSRNQITDRSKDNCPTCELPKTRGKAIVCKRCHINFHVECVVGNKEKIESYKSGTSDFECEECYLDIEKVFKQPETYNDKEVEESERCQENTSSEEEISMLKCDECEFKTMEMNNLTNHVNTQHEQYQHLCEICSVKCKCGDDLMKHMKEVHTVHTVIDLVNQENSEEESAAIEHLRKKCEYMEEVINNEQKVNADNLKALKEHEETIKHLKKEVEKADERTRNENSKVKEANDELVKLKEKMNREIIENMNKSKLIEELKDKLNNADSGRTESEEIKKIKEKALELKATNELKINKLKEKHSVEINELQIKKIRVEEELSSVVKENQKLKESERILLETFDTLKKYYEKSENLEFNCRKCRFSCKTKEELDKHKENEHGLNFSCMKCANRFDSYQNLQEHLRLHEEQERMTSFECEICSYKGKTEQSIENHIERIHTCGECKTLFEDVYELNRHKENKHTPQFQCDNCGFSVTNQTKLNEHKRSHDILKHSCEFCGKEENSESKIEEHIRNEHMTEIYRRIRQSKNRASYQRVTTSKKERMKYSTYDRKLNGICSYWSRGKCTFGEFCRFSHDDPPKCVYGVFCNRKQNCRFSHSDDSEKRTFLGPRPRYTNKF